MTALTKDVWIRTFDYVSFWHQDHDARLMATMLKRIANGGDVDKILDRYASQMLEAEHHVVD